MCNLSYSPDYSGTWTESTVCGFPHQQSKLFVPVWPWNSVQSCPNQVLKQWIVQAFRDANSEPCLLLSIVLSPNHLRRLTRELTQPLSPSYSLAWAGSQARSPIQLFSASSTPPLTSELVQCSHPKIDPERKPSIPKDINRWNVRASNWADWWRTVSAKVNL